MLLFAVSLLVASIDVTLYVIAALILMVWSVSLPLALCCFRRERYAARCFDAG